MLRERWWPDSGVRAARRVQAFGRRSRAPPRDNENKEGAFERLVTSDRYRR